MVEKLKDLKDDLLMQVERDMNEGRSADPKMIDSIKDLAEAEKACWEAEYYRAVTEAMEDGSMGYEDGMSYAQGVQQGGRGRGGRRGYRGQQRDSMGRYARRGYRQGRYGHDDVMQTVKDMMMSASPQEKEQIKQKLRQMADM